MKVKTALNLALLFALFTAVAALAEDAIIITLPASDLVTTAKPFVVSVAMPEALADAKPAATVELHRAEPGLEKQQPIAASVRLAPVKAEGSAACTVALDASMLAEGEYAGTITVTAGDAKQSAAFSLFRMPEGRPKDFPYGTYAVRFHFAPDPVTKKQMPDKAQQIETFREMQAAGINLIQQHMYGMDNYTWTMDQAARYGVWFMPSTNVLGHGLEQKEDILAVMSDSKPMDSWLKICMFTPKVRETSVEKYKEAIRQFLTHPAFSGKMLYGDDLCMPAKRADGKVILTCYCERCKDAFKAIAGTEPPVGCERTAGVVPANDVFLQWMRFRCGEVYGGYLREMENAKNAVDPSLAIGPIHGWSEAPFTRIDAGIYPPLQQTLTAVSSYVYPNLRSPRMDFISQYELGRMGNRDKEVWMLGQISMDAVCPPWRIYQNFWNMTA
ncbi:MAG TPA: hypothetical protein VM186_04105, partial [Planctomycetota bacterium]|nr:hypothetical protein [Planctomycetota bacterium]